MVYAGRVIDVDPLRYTCVVKTEGGGENSKTFYDVQLGSGVYEHPFGGEGVYAMPEVGALVYVCKPSERTSLPFISAYRPYSNRSASTSTQTNKPSCASNRPRLSPGDMVMLGRDRNGVFVRRGQLTEILGGPLSRTIYEGRTGTIHTLAQHLKTDVFGGSVRWEVDRPEKDPDGKKQTRADLKLKEYANDRGYVARVSAGGGLDATFAGDPDGETNLSGPAPASLEVITAPVLRVRVYADGNKEESSLDTVTSLAFDKDGAVELSAKSTVVIEVRGSKNVTFRLDPDGTVTFGADVSITQTANGLTVVQDSTGVTVGAGTAAPLYDTTFSADAAAAWTEVVAIGAAAGVATPNSAKHLASLSGAAYTAKKLKTE